LQATKSTTVKLWVGEEVPVDRAPVVNSFGELGLGDEAELVGFMEEVGMCRAAALAVAMSTVRVWWGKRWEGEKSRWGYDKIEERYGMCCGALWSHHSHEDDMHGGRERRAMWKEEGQREREGNIQLGCCCPCFSMTYVDKM
jgi:hypothetical protein